MVQITVFAAEKQGKSRKRQVAACRTVAQWVALALLLPGSALALGLGEIRLHSSLNAPLDADIELLGASGDELATLQPRLASRETFARYGIDYPAFLSNISLRVVRGPDGRNRVQLRSSAPIIEPFATVLVEVVWPRGRFIREYSVLLDPPVFTPAAAAPAAAVAAPVVNEPPRNVPQAVLAAVPRAAGPAPEAGVSPPAGGNASAVAAGGTYEVKRGDTVTRIAASLVGGASNRVNQAVLAIYQANTSAFDGNVNLLRSGAVLRMPDAATIAAIDANQAQLELRRQAAQWRGETASTQAEPRLKLVPPSGPAATPSAPSGRPAAAVGGQGTPAAGSSMESRVAALEAELAESRRLLEVRNAELAAAQTAAAQHTETAPVAPPPAEAAQPQPAPAPVEKPKPPVAVAAPPATPGPLAEFFKDYGVAAVVVAALALLLGLLAVRRVRAQRAVADLLDESGEAEESNAERYRRLESNTQPLRSPNIANIEDADPSFLVEESVQQPPAAELPRPLRQTAQIVVPPVAAPPLAKPADESTSDALQEADLYMAYGLFDQAAVMLRKSIGKEPERRELWLKLLEVCFVWGNKAAFCEAAGELAKTREQSTPAEWDQILIMGRQLAPENALFAGAVSSAGGSGPVDLNLEGGQNIIDFDMFGQTQVDPQAQVVDIDFGDEIDANDPASTIVSDESLDFQFDDPQRGSDPLLEDTITNIEPVKALREELDIALDDEEDLPAEHLDRTAELALDDLDLGSMDPTDSQRIDDSRVTRALEGDMDSLEAALPPISDVTGAWELPGAEPVAKPAVVAPAEVRQVAEAEPVEEDPLDSASLSEVGTKLDLARAYIDMGDPEGARSIIEEVLLEGSSAQVLEGRRLLGTIPG